MKIFFSSFEDDFSCRCELFIAAAHRSRNQDGRPERPRWLRADLRFPVVPVKGAWQRDEPQGQQFSAEGSRSPFLGGGKSQQSVKGLQNPRFVNHEKTEDLER